MPDGGGGDGVLESNAACEMWVVSSRERRVIRERRGENWLLSQGLCSDLQRSEKQHLNEGAVLYRRTHTFMYVSSWAVFKNTTSVWSCVDDWEALIEDLRVTFWIVFSTKRWFSISAVTSHQRATVCSRDLSEVNKQRRQQKQRQLVVVPQTQTLLTESKMQDCSKSEGPKNEQKQNKHGYLLQNVYEWK